MNETSLKCSMRRELNAIQRFMQEERAKPQIELGRDVYHLSRKDCSDFQQGDFRARIKFAQESGLFPKE